MQKIGFRLTDESDRRLHRSLDYSDWNRMMR